MITDWRKVYSALWPWVFKHIMKRLVFPWALGKDGLCFNTKALLSTKKAVNTISTILFIVWLEHNVFWWFIWVIEVQQRSVFVCGLNVSLCECVYEGPPGTEFIFGLTHTILFSHIHHYTHTHTLLYSFYTYVWECIVVYVRVYSRVCERVQ